MTEISTLRPRGDRVIVRPEEARETESGIVIPDTVKSKSQAAVVVAVGPGRTLEDGSIWPVAVQPGDRVVVAAYAGTEVEDVRIVRESDVLAVIE